MNIKKTEKLLEEAARWSARLWAADCSDQERAELQRWLRESPAHADAFAAAQVVSNGLAELSKLDTSFAAMADEAYAQGAGDTVPAERPSPARPRWALPLGLAAGIVVAVMGAQLVSRMNDSGANVEVYKAESATRHVQLADGSSIRLDAGAKLRVAFETSARRVELLEGRALFEVAHDRARPFSVSANGSRTTALGTRFQVEEADDGAVTVILTEGSVVVDRPESSRERQEKLVPGERLSIAADSDPAWVKSEVDVEVATSWARGRLIFRSTPLGEAIAEVNRYSATKLVLGDPSLSNLELSGNFIPGDSHRVASALASVLPVRAVEGGKEIVLFRRHLDAGG